MCISSINCHQSFFYESNENNLETIFYKIIKSENTPKKYDLETLEKILKNKIALDQNGCLEIKISGHNKNTDDLLKTIQKLSPFDRNRVKIHLIPPEDCDIFILKELFDRYGQYSDSLTLVNYMINDDQFKDFTKNCTNLNYLFLENKKIVSISNLPNLKTLYCRGCSALQKLNNFPNLEKLICGDTPLQELSNLPNLKKLDCRRCYDLQKLNNFPKLEKLNCDSCKSLQKLNNFPNLKELDCTWCITLQELNNFPKLEKLNCNSCTSLRKLNNLPKLEKLYCRGCEALQKLNNFPKLEKLNCENTRLQELNNFPKLEKLNCRDTPLQELNNFPKLETLNCGSCTALRLINTKQGELPLVLRFAKLRFGYKGWGDLDIKKLKDLYEGFFGSKDTVTFETTDGEKKILKGKLRKEAFTKFPFLFEYLSLKYCRTTNTDILYMPEDLVIDTGEIDKYVSKHCAPAKINQIRRIPFSNNPNMSSSLIIKMVKSGQIKLDWFPKYSEGGKDQPSYWELVRTERGKEFLREQQSFCDVLYACIRLNEELGFKFKKYKPRSFPQFLTEMIESTVRFKKESWSKILSKIPAVLIKGSLGHCDIKDAVNDFITTVFLPHYLRENFKGKKVDVRRIYERTRLDIMKKFLKGTPITSIVELSNRWHEQGRAVQLAKAKNFSDYSSWPPLFSPPVDYDYEGKTLTAIPLTCSRELKEEGQKLIHCVSGYAKNCILDSSHIISLREQGKPRSTIELELRKGKGRKLDTNAINIDGEDCYHLRLIQHRGLRNALPEQICNHVAEQLFEDIRHRKVKVTPGDLEKKRKARVFALEERPDLILIGYDSNDDNSFNAAKRIYREHGIGQENWAKKLVYNFDVLVGEKKQVSSKSKGKGKSIKQDDKQYLEEIKTSFNKILEKDVVQISAIDSKKKRHGHVKVDVSATSSLSLDEVIEKLKKRVTRIQRFPIIKISDKAFIIRRSPLIVSQLLKI